MGKEKYSKEKLYKLNHKAFRRFLGTDKAVFNLMCISVENAYKKHKKGGRHSKLTQYDMVVLFLLYIRQYNSMEDYALLYEVSKSVICELYILS